MSIPKSDLTSLMENLYVQIKTIDAEILSIYPIVKYHNHLDHIPKSRGYSSLDENVKSISEDILSRTDKSTLGKYHKLLFLYLINTLDERFPAQSIPDSIVALIRLEIQRIYADIKTQEDDFYLLSNDFFLKDLGICLFTLLPCGAELVQITAGVPKKILFRDGVGQFFKGLYFFSQLGGFRPFYTLHMDPRRLEEFNPEGWDRTYLRIADLLKLHPEIKGVFGTAWFYDPQLEKISPQLVYLRKRREDNGAQNFKYGTNLGVVRNALAKSKTRRRLYEEGRYLPTSYYLVWARDDLLRWAERNKKKINMKDTY